jgi:hypothetical protein
MKGKKEKKKEVVSLSGFSIYHCTLQWTRGRLQKGETFHPRESERKHVLEISASSINRIITSRRTK